MITLCVMYIHVCMFKVKVTGRGTNAKFVSGAYSTSYNQSLYHMSQLSIMPIYMIQICMSQVMVCTGQGQLENLFLEHNFHIP